MFDPQQMDGPVASEWAQNVGQIMQGHLALKDAVQSSDQAGQQIADTLSQFRAGATGYVQRDPSALPAVLQTIPHTMAALTADHPEDTREAVATGLMQGMAADVTRAAVTSAAGQHEGFANLLLDKHASLLPDADVTTLRGYIGNMAAMRQADAEGQARDDIRDTHNGSDAAAAQHLADLAHPDTGQLMFPPQWGQRMMSDPRLLPHSQGALLHAYARLQVAGEPAQPDPDVVSDIVQRAAVTRPNSPGHPTVSQVIRQAGYGLSAADASWLASKVGPQSVDGRAERSALADTLQNARSMIGNKDAYGRFVSWFLPAYQQKTAMGMPWADVLSPESKGYVLNPQRMQRFMPTGDDMMAPITAAVDRKQRPNLGQIFAAGYTPDPTSVFGQMRGGTPNRPMPSPPPWATGKAFPTPPTRPTNG